MANTSDYFSEDNKMCGISFEIKAEIIELIIIKNNNYFKSIYRLEFLNDKFGKKAIVLKIYLISKSSLKKIFQKNV